MRVNLSQLSIRWFVMATPPAIISDSYGSIDDAIMQAAASLAPPSASLTPKSAALLFLSSAAGGAGFICYGAHGARLYEANASPWPPQQLNVSSSGITEKHTTWAAMREAIDDLQLENARGVLNRHQMKANTDATLPWYNITRMTKYEAIRNDDWAVMWAHTIGMHVPYSVCDPNDGDPWDHFHRCRPCGGGALNRRHDRVVSAFNAAARRYGLVSSTDFYSSFGMENHASRPDIVVYRMEDEKPPLVLDVRITHTSDTAIHDMTLHGIATKKAKYKDWMKGEVEFAPFIMTSQASMPAPSIDILKELGRYALAGFVPHVIRRIKCAIVATSSLNVRYLEARSVNRSSQRSLAEAAAASSLSSPLTL